MSSMPHLPLPGSMNLPALADPPGVRNAESPVDHALTLLLAGEIDAALRWAAAALERVPSPASLIVTARLLDQMGRTRAASDGLRLAVQQAVDASDLPLAIAAIDDLRNLGLDVGEHLDFVATAFGRGSSRFQRGDMPRLPPPPANDFIQPLSPFLAGPALASKATQILQNAKRAYDEALGADAPRVAPLPFFSALSPEALRDVLASFQTLTAPAGQRIIQEGAEGTAAYVLARGEIEIGRRAARGDNKFALALARLGSGSFFGEMALLSPLPNPATATATRPSILLVAKRETLTAVAAGRPEVAAHLAAYCRGNSLSNLGWTSPVVAAVPPVERASLVERLETRIFDKGDRLIHDGTEAPGLHLVVSGEVAIVAREWGERVLLATLGAGETVGEMELVLCRQAFADAVATRPTATLFLSRDEYTSLVQDHPAILHGLYAIAVQRHTETAFALQSGSATVVDEWLLKEPTKDTSAQPALAAQTLRALSTSGFGITTSEPAAVRMNTPPPPGIAPSIPPTSTTVRPPVSLAPPPPRSDIGWLTPVAAAGFAALAASVLTVLALHARRGAAAQVAGDVVDTQPPAVVATVAPVPVEPTPVVAPATGAVANQQGGVGVVSAMPSIAATAGGAALLPARLLARPKPAAAAPRPPVVVHLEPIPRPAPVAVASASLPSVSPRASASAAPRAPSTADSALAHSATVAADDFGGRQ